MSKTIAVTLAAAFMFVMAIIGIKYDGVLAFIGFALATAVVYLLEKEHYGF